MPDHPAGPHQAGVRLLVLSASLREGSLNARLADLAAATIEANGGQVDRATMAEFDAPAFNADTESLGPPSAADAFRQRLEASDGFVIASPEYNAAMPGVLKNAVDWVSRFRPQPFNERQALLMSASPSMMGGNRGLWSLRVPLEHLGARVYPDMFSLSRAQEMLDESDRITDPKLQERFESTVVAFMDLVEASTRYPCVKRAWVEFLGERTESSADIPTSP